ncbi:MAG: GNAT family N-acetyltransferase [Rhodanobacteraceae bacterium]|nr:GNAT family N-acetyltransferase [Rhodanobacteraceae bacterium]
MSLILRDIEAEDLDAVWALNNSAGCSIVPIDRERMRQLFEVARYFRVAHYNGELAGFQIALSPEARYDSPNFLWFREHFADFLYIDRIVIDSRFRRHGIGRVFYADVLSFAEVRYPILTCEVFIEPRDDVALVFFGTNGFQEVGQQVLPLKRRVSLMVKEMKAYRFVQDTYRAAGAQALPQQLDADRLTRRSA